MARHQRDPRLEQTWRQHLQRQEASGQTARAYCRQHGLAETAFHYWRRTIAQRDRQARRSSPVPAFVPVVVAGRAPGADGASIDIRLAGGHRLRVRAGCDRDLLAAVLALLEGRPC
jgi:transposase-like protein